MIKQLFLLFLLFFFPVLKAQQIYSKDYGKRQDPAVIFIHGGPSGNSNLFEATTAQHLANLGFYVIVYDRPGEGRSKDENAKMTFNESFDDLLQIYTTYKLEKATILGHSFGGIIATLFSEKYPKKVTTLILAGALISQQETYNHILSSAEENFKNNPEKIAQISKIKNLNKNSAEYRKQCFELADEMDFFNMPIPTEESKTIRRIYEKSDLYKTNFRNHNSSIKFYQNESKNNLNNETVLKNIKKNRIPIYAVYGKDDAIFSLNQLKELQKITGKSNFKFINNCSHYLFVDQQTEFLKFLSRKLK
ncbi:alpha/beta hydrolase [Empedobacter brevis]|uniref:alpha/beta hydrolase n=1 Tax=Empedobacter brevis TaxID=247 RepID=UPI002FE26CB0